MDSQKKRVEESRKELKDRHFEAAQRGMLEQELELKDISRSANRLNIMRPSLYKRAQAIYHRACGEIYPHQKLPGFTEHGVDHVHRVLVLADKLLDGLDSPHDMYPGEYFLLITSILLHDVGQLCQDVMHNQAEQVHAEHASKSREIINDKADRFGLSLHEADVIGHICHSHGEKHGHLQTETDWSIETIGEYRPMVVMALLRIADMLDLTHTRAPLFVFQLQDLPAVSAKHWERHEVTQDVRIQADKCLISVYTRPYSIKQLDDLRDFQGWLQSELDAVQADFARIGLYYTKIDLRTDVTLFCRPLVADARDNPFRGLSSFGFAQSDFFFGRVVDIRRIIKRSKNTQLFVLVGESGVGKTSIVEAGLFPQLKQLGAQTGTYRLELPIEKTLTGTIAKTLGIRGKSSLADVQSKLDRLHVRKRCLFLHLDQFEELFTLPFDEDATEQGLKRLADLTSTAPNLRIIITIREEFVFRLMKLGEQIELPLTINNMMGLGKLSPEAAREAIEKPMLKFTNLSFSCRLVEEILCDLQDPGPDVYPPYLQLICRKLVDAKLAQIKDSCHASDFAEYQIDLELYRKFGGAEEIIRQHFQTILDGFSPTERNVIDQVLSRMITEYSTKKPVLDQQIEEINDKRIDIKSAMKKLINSRVIKRVHFGYELEHDLLARKLLTILRQGAKASSQIRNVIDYIQNNKRRNLTIEMLRKKAKLSRAQFTRRFSSEIGLKPVEYIQNVRIDEARWLLRDTSDPIGKIAERSGFRTAVHFVSVFKKLNDGMTPSVFREWSRTSHSREFA